ncbi:uncharacterized protein A4U43_C10F9610 [Asparagus officinalis]|uniref:Uncharacterized protein n=1 Tax=Asparagus officinalis TaxID=4686 RepID=A0A5P1E683_ASPOF|nr:uncharacterized protein A4U43_C10F9610 [Asparagus officinalis]
MIFILISMLYTLLHSTKPWVPLSFISIYKHYIHYLRSRTRQEKLAVAYIREGEKVEQRKLKEEMASSGSIVQKGMMRAASSSSASSSSKAQGKDKATSGGGLFSSMARSRTMPVTRSEHEGRVPEWKLNCLCHEQNLPPTIKSQLGGGGCF